MEIGPVYDIVGQGRYVALRKINEGSQHFILQCKKTEIFLKISVDTSPSTPLYAAHQRGRRAAGAFLFALVKSKRAA
jgi:hypothetical protein